MEALSDVGLQKGIHCPSNSTQFASSSSLVPTRTLSCLTLKLEESSGFHPSHDRNCVGVDFQIQAVDIHLLLIFPLSAMYEYSHGLHPPSHSYRYLLSYGWPHSTRPKLKKVARRPHEDADNDYIIGVVSDLWL
jgi:hypothetical protein